MDASFFAFGLAGAFLGYIIGDFQRERRYRRDARANLAQSIETLSDGRPVPNTNGHDYIRSGFDSFPVPRTNSHRDTDRDTLGDLRDGQARRRAVSRADYGVSSTAPVRGRGSRVATSTAVGAGYDCG